MLEKLLRICYEEIGKPENNISLTRYKIQLHIIIKWILQIESLRREGDKLKSPFRGNGYKRDGFRTFQINPTKKYHDKFKIIAGFLKWKFNLKNKRS